jgi:hypothetical protein
LGIPKFLTKLDAVSLLQLFCHLERNMNATNMCYTTSLSAITDTSDSVLGSKKSRMHMKVPSTTILSFPTLSPLLYSRKEYSRILFGQTMYVPLLLYSVIIVWFKIFSNYATLLFRLLWYWKHLVLIYPALYISGSCAAVSVLSGSDWYCNVTP